jgi:hypothetical protein
MIYLGRFCSWGMLCCITYSRVCSASVIFMLMFPFLWSTAMFSCAVSYRLTIGLRYDDGKMTFASWITGMEKKKKKKIDGCWREELDCGGTRNCIMLVMTIDDDAMGLLLLLPNISYVLWRCYIGCLYYMLHYLAALLPAAWTAVSTKYRNCVVNVV